MLFQDTTTVQQVQRQLTNLIGLAEGEGETELVKILLEAKISILRMESDGYAE